MNEFDISAREWDNNPDRWERSEAVTKNLLENIPVKPYMKALEYGAGTGILSFFLAPYFSEITMMDNSQGMVEVMHEKVLSGNKKTLKPVLFNLEETDYDIQKFDCIFTQMVLHHVLDTKTLLARFYDILNDEGYLAIADLYPEDGSFHGEGFIGHNGFNPDELKITLEKTGFRHIVTKPCYIRKKPVNNEMKEYPIFLLIAKKLNLND